LEFIAKLIVHKVFRAELVKFSTLIFDLWDFEL
jgi:hypothetical protein